MEISKEKSNDTMIISINGEIDTSTCGELGNYFQEQLPKQNKIIAEFSKVEYISSAGLRVLLSTLKETRKLGGDFRLASVKDNVQKVLDISGFSRMGFNRERT